MRRYRATQVFVPGGMPQHTYVDRAERELEKQLLSVKDNLCKLVTLTGSTKSGKTVLASRIFPRLGDECVWIDGGTVETEEDLWLSVLGEVGGYSSAGVDQANESSQAFSGDIEAEAGIPLVVKGKGRVGTSLTRKNGTVKKKSLHLSAKNAAITQLNESGKPLVIDDFHYLDRDIQGVVIRAVKPLVFEGHPVVVIAIPHRRYDAVKVEREMTGRLKSIPVPIWSIEELMEIPNVGFPILNVNIEGSISERLAKEAYGSPHLMQEFCRGLCMRQGIEETKDEKLNIASVDDSIFVEIAEGTGKVIFDKLAKGPRQRSDRMPRPLMVGGTADIYKVVLLALAKLAPGMEKVDYELLRTAIRDTLTSNVPQAHEVSRVLEKMGEIASSDEASTPVLDWDKEDQVLHVTDPFFAFFLKWGTSSFV